WGEKAGDGAPSAPHGERAVQTDGDIRQLSCRVAADSAAVQAAGREVEIFRNQGQQHRTAYTCAECGLVVGGSDHGRRARDARTEDAPPGIFPQEPLQPVYFVVTPAGIERRFLDDVRRLVGRDVHVLQEISPAPGVDEVDYCAIDDATAGECASGSEWCGRRAADKDRGRVFDRHAEGD